MGALAALGAGLLVYLAFLAWYDGWPRRKLSAAEVDAFVGKMKAQRAANNRSDDLTLERFRILGASDDGREFYMVNLIRNRKIDNVAGAHAAYLRAWSKPAVPRASHPVFRGVPPVKLFGLPESERWDSIALMRYRSRRDLFRIVTDDTFAREAALKGVAVAYTDVYPTPVGLMMPPPRLFVFLLILVVSLVAAWAASLAW
jgi:hypothetical protein